MFLQIINRNQKVMAEGHLKLYKECWEDDICATLGQLQGLPSSGYYPRVRMGSMREAPHETVIQIEIDTGETDEQ